jgi:hypothetical protein
MKAVKYNYCGLNHQDCYLWFDNNFTALNWKSSTKIWNLKSKIKLSEVSGVIFGAFSSAFSEHKKYVLNYSKFKSFLNDDN